MHDFAKAESLYRMAIRANPGQHDSNSQRSERADRGGKKAATDSFMAIEERRLQSNSAYAYHLIIRAHVDGSEGRAEHLADSIHGASKIMNTKAAASYFGAQLAATHGRLAEAERRYRQLAVREQRDRQRRPADRRFNHLRRVRRVAPQSAARAAARLDNALAVHPLASIPERDRPTPIWRGPMPSPGVQTAPGHSRSVRPDQGHGVVPESPVARS
jgi:hypothetical protein